MMDLTIKLRDGFANDTVTITVNDKEVYRKAGVRTNLAISFADTVTVNVQEPTVKLGVALEGGQRAAKEIHVPETPYVDVWVMGGKVELRTSAEETPML